MNYVVLSDVAKIIMGQSPPSTTYNTTGEGLPFFQGKADFGELYPTPRVYCSEPNRIAEPGDILITVRAPVGPTNMNRERSCIGRGLSALRVGNNLDCNFLFYFLRYYEPELAKVGTGSTFAAISREDLESIKLSLPPLSEQQRIASILQKADRLRRLHRYTRQLSDTYLQSVFLEMFGDLNDNPNQHEFRLLEELADVVSGVTKGQDYGNKEIIEVPYLRVANVQDGFLDLSEIKTICVPPSEAESLWLEKGDILMTEGGDFDKLGRGAIWDGQIPRCIHQNHIFRARFNQTLVLPYFFEAFLLSGFAKKYFLGASKKTTNLASINITQLKNLPVPLPSLKEQRSFVEVVNRFNRVSNQQKEAIRQVEYLFQSLLQRVFQG